MANLIYHDFSRLTNCSEIKMMFNEVLRKVGENTGLVLLVGDKETNSLILKKMKEHLHSAILINLGHSLSQKLLHNQIEITQNPQNFFADLLKNIDEKFILLDNTDILFDSNLKFDPLSIFKKIASQKNLIAVWNGTYCQDQLTFAKQGHSEYRYFNIYNNEIFIILSQEISL